MKTRFMSLVLAMVICFAATSAFAGTQYKTGSWTLEKMAKIMNSDAAPEKDGITGFLSSASDLIDRFKTDLGDDFEITCRYMEFKIAELRNANIPLTPALLQIEKSMDRIKGNRELDVNSATKANVYVYASIATKFFSRLDLEFESLTSQNNRELVKIKFMESNGIIDAEYAEFKRQALPDVSEYVKMRKNLKEAMAQLSLYPESDNTSIF